MWSSPETDPVWESKIFDAKDAADAQALANNEARGGDGWCEETPSVVAIGVVTKNIIINFTKIAQGSGVILQVGPIQKVARLSKQGKGNWTMLAVGTLPEAWPKTTAVDSGKFVKALALFKKPVIQFNLDHFIVNGGPSELAASHGGIEYCELLYSDASMALDLANVNPLTENPAVELGLSRSTLTAARSVFVTIAVDSKSAAIKAHGFTIGVPEVVRHDPTFTCSMQFEMSHFKLLLNGDYTVALAATWPYAYLTNKRLPVTYFIAGSHDGR